MKVIEMSREMKKNIALAMIWAGGFLIGLVVGMNL